ncbi:MAG: 2-amino-4-hydroxy-6-hydroxymethyldihydropteridine diphosphokinase [Granulosicoccus sp.]
MSCASNDPAVTVYISLGSNIEPEANLRVSLRAITELLDDLVCGHVYRSAAVGFDGADFLNTVAKGQTCLPAEALSARLHDIEDAQGRDRRQPRFSSRPIDLDLLLYGDTVQHDDVVDVPRPEILQQAFVLLPLAELAPELKHPETDESFAALLSDFEECHTDKVAAMHRVEFRLLR